MKRNLTTDNLATENYVLEPTIRTDSRRSGRQPSHHLGKKLPDLLPARMLNEFVYCQQLFFYEWVEGVYQESSDTIGGEAKHVRVDRGPMTMPRSCAGATIHSRSVTLPANALGSPPKWI